MLSLSIMVSLPDRILFIFFLYISNVLNLYKWGVLFFTYTSTYLYKKHNHVHTNIHTEWETFLYQILIIYYQIYVLYILKTFSYVYFLAGRCMGSAFRVVAYFREFHCGQVSHGWIPRCPIPSFSLTSRAMNKGNHSDLPFKAFFRGLQFRSTVQVL